MTAPAEMKEPAAIQDPYEVLGIQRTATLDDIKAAYKRLALQYHPDKNQEQPEVAAERFKAIATSYSILSDPDKRRRYDSGGMENLQQSDLEIDFSELGRLDAMMVAMFARMGVPFRTAVAKQVLLGVENGEVTARPLRFAEMVVGKVDRQAAEFFELQVTQEAIDAGFCIFCHSPQQSRFKLLLFEQSSGGHWSLVSQEDSSKMGKVTLAGFYFLGYITYQLPPPSLAELQARAAAAQQEPELEFFHQLETLRERPRVQLNPGRYLIGVYGDNWFKKAYYTLEAVVCSGEPPQALRIAEESLAARQQALRALDQEYFAAKKAYTEACAKVEAFQTELQVIVKQREDAYLDLHRLAPGKGVARSAAGEGGKPLAGLRNMFGFGQRTTSDGGAVEGPSNDTAAGPSDAPPQAARGAFGFPWRKTATQRPQSRAGSDQGEPGRAQAHMADLPPTSQAKPAQRLFGGKWM